jgi:molybdopterin synthase sulfur carrier subunit
VAVTIRLFAGLREITGAGELVRDVPAPATVAAAWDALTREWPALEPYRASLSCAVNAEYAKFTDLIDEDDEVAFLPPVSGG